MRHKMSYRRLGRRSDHRKAMMKNLTLSPLDNERIETTVTRAKELRKFVERMITLGKKGTLHDRRRAFAFLRTSNVQEFELEDGKITEATFGDMIIKKLFEEIAPRYAERNGGYTRIIKTAVRRGDSSEMAIIELV